MIPDSPFFTPQESLDDSTKRKKRVVHPFWWVLQTLVVIYFSLGFLLYYMQEWFLFHPEKVDRTDGWVFSIPFKELDVPYNGTDTFNMVRFLPKDSVRGIILYFHGNRQHIARYAKYAPLFTNEGYEVWMPDYPGFGKSTGRRSEALMNLQAEVIYRMASKQVAPNRILVYGKSMGSGPASYLATRFPVRKLMLETPYPSIPIVMKRFAPIFPTELLSNYQFPVREYLHQLRETEILILHGTNDGLIPYDMVSTLKAVLKPTDRFVTINGGEHNNLADYPAFQQAIQEQLR